MPLLRKKPFQRLHVSSDFRDNDEVFHCEVTNEIFKDFNEFCERIILCNSLIWSCSITGKSNLTYEDALESEENAKKSVKEFPLELRIPILYLAHKTNRKSFRDMIEDVFQYARERFFVGEMVDVCLKEDTWCECHILQVIEPTEQQIKAYQASDNEANSQDRNFSPPAKLFKYEVEQLDAGDSDINQLLTVDAGQIRRRKHQYSRDRNKIFLRMLCEQNSNGVWVVKESVLQKYGILKTRFDTIFAGPLPDFTTRPKKVVKQKQESIEKFLTSDSSKHRAFSKPDPLKKLNDSGLIKKKHSKSKIHDKNKEEQMKAKAEEQKKQQRLEKQERKKKEKIKQVALQAYIKAWNKPREDLECEDLCLLPEPVPVNCDIPNEKFGDVVMILEFLQFFHKELKVKMYFPSGVNLDLLEKALLKTETSGPWSDLLQLLLSNIFKYQEEEEDEIHADENTISDTVIDQGVSSMAEAVKLATIASTWTQNHQGCHLSQISLDHVTLSEVLRQHLLASGGRIGDVASKWRYSQRGGYTNHDDPALLLRMNEARVLRLLGHRSVCELELDDKLKVISCLINQLLTFASIRDIIEERHEKINNAKKELKMLFKAEQKKEREEREKMKEREKEGKVEEDEPKPKKVTRNNCEEEKKKEEFESKVKELQEASKDDQMMVWLGSDRAHRRYWRFLSIPGIFVENHELYAGTCISGGTPYKPELRDKESIYTYLMNKFEEENDKENNFAGKKSPKKMFLEKNGLKSPRKEVSPRKSSKYDINNYNELRKKLFCCTGNITCPVHWMTTGGPKWSFLSNSEDIENLIQSLNKRGYREKELRENLIHEAEDLRAVIERCPKNKLNPERFPEAPVVKETTSKSKKSRYENANLNFPPDVPVDSVLEATLQEYILELEDKIRNGCLGTLKVHDREAWRKALQEGRYDKQCDKLSYSDGTEIEVDALTSSAVNSTLEKIKTEAKNSRPNTPDSEVGSGATKIYRDPGKYLGPPSKDEVVPDQKQQESIRNMACAILQLAQAVKLKDMEKPLGPDKNDKKGNCEELRDRWEQSLLGSTSWSQLFVHIHTLDSSISWSKSSYNTQCRICKRRRDAENMLLCDGCNKGHHLYCLKPKLFAVPEGDWFCDKCKPLENKPKPETKKRRKFEEEDEDIEMTKETRHTRAKRVATPSDEEEPDEIDEEEDDEEDDEDEEEDDEYDNDEEEKMEEDDPQEPEKPVELCSVCSGSGKMFACDTCQKNFHLKCVTPKLGRPPRGRWSCFQCKAAKYNHKTDGSLTEDKEIRMTRRSSKRAAELEEDRKSIKSCKIAIQALMADIAQHRDSWPFMAPVTKEEVPDYHEYISHPMDFGTVKKKFDSDSYETVQQFVQDCTQIFKNCEIYNRENSSVYKAGNRLLKFVEKRCKELGIDFQTEENQEPDAKRRKVNGNSVENGDVEHSDDDEQMSQS